MRAPFPLLACLLGIVLLVSTRPACAQLKMVVERDGNLHRVVSLSRDQPIAIGEDGKRVRAKISEVAFALDERFAEGFVEIEYETEEPKATANRNRLDRIRPTAKIDAFLTADRDLEDCVLVFAFPSDGRVSTSFRRLGNLRAGSTRRVFITIGGPVDGRGYGHVFARGREVRSTDSGEPGQSLFSQVLPAPIKPLRELVGLDAPQFALSADGLRLARLAPWGDSSQLIVHNASGGDILASMPIGSSYRRGGRIFWLNQETCIVHYGDALLRADLNTQTLTLIRDHLSGPFQPIPDRPEILYARRHKRVVTHQAETRLYEFEAIERIDCLTGEVEIEDPPKQSKERFAHAWRLPDGRPVVWSDRDDGATRYFVRDREGAEWVPIDTINREPGLAFVEDPRKPTPGRIAQVLDLTEQPDEVYIATNHASDRVEICRYSLTTGRVTRTVARNAHYDVDGLGASASPLILDRRTRALLGLAYQADLPRVTLFDARLAAAHALVEASYPGFTHVPGQWSHDLTRVLFRSRSDSVESIPLLVDTSAGTVAPLSPTDASAGGGRTVLRRLSARDGYTLDAYLTYPPFSDNRPLPIIVLAHDTFSERATGGLDPTSQFFAARGYLAVRVNNRGCSGYGKQHLIAGLQGGLDGPFIDDLADAVERLIESGDGRRDAVFIAGQRMGGYVAMLSLIEYPHLYAAGASAFGYEEIAKEFNIYDLKRWPSIHGPLGTLIAEQLHKDKRYARRVCPIRRADEIDAPLLVVEDSAGWWGVVRVRSKVHDALRKRGSPSELVAFARPLYPRPLDPDVLAHLLSIVEQFFSRHTPPEDTELADAG